jgi:hypothetical protein
MSVPRKTPAKGAAPKFVTSKGASGVKVSPGKGGVNIGTPRGCESTRAHGNVKTGY